MITNPSYDTFQMVQLGSRKCKVSFLQSMLTIKMVILWVLLLTTLTACTNHKSQSIKDINLRVDKLIEHSRYNEALIELSQAIEEGNFDIDTQLSLAIIYNYRKEYKKAEEILNQVLLNDINNAKARYHLGVIYKNQGIVEKGIIEMKKSILLDKKNLSAYKDLGAAYESIKDFMNAAAVYQDALKIFPHDHMIHFTLANVYFKINQYDEALAECKKAYELSPVEKRDDIYEIMESIKLKQIIESNLP